MSNTFLDDIIAMTAGESLNQGGVELTEMQIEMAFGESAQLAEEALVDAASFSGELLMHAVVVSGENALANTAEKAKALGYRAKGSIQKVFQSIIKFFKSMLSWFTGAEGDLKKVRAKAKETLKRLDKATGVIKEDTDLEVLNFDFAKFFNTYLENRLEGGNSDIMATMSKIESEPAMNEKINQIIRMVMSMVDSKVLSPTTDGEAKKILTEWLENKDMEDAKDIRKDFLAGDLAGFSAKVDKGENELKAHCRAQLNSIETVFNKNLKIQKMYDKAVKTVEKISKDYQKDNTNISPDAVSTLSKAVAVLGKDRQTLIIYYTALKSAGYKAITLGERVAAMYRPA
ncbi:MAG: hypothetical protein ACRCX2_34285 [Paraclostridium sp.]